MDVHKGYETWLNQHAEQIQTESENGMQVLSVNVSLPREVQYKGRKVMTGIFKEAVHQRLMLRQLNLDGDRQADLVAHGGRYKAAYFYAYDHYATWAQEEKRNDLRYGQFGENFTVSGMLEKEVFVGNIYRIGTALVQVTQPRVPCYKLGIKMGDATFVKRFMQKERTGFYVRVLEEGEVGTGDAVEHVQVDPQQMSVYDINHLLYFEPDMELAKKALRIEALSPGWRSSFEEMLTKK